MVKTKNKPGINKPKIETNPESKQTGEVINAIAKKYVKKIKTKTGQKDAMNLAGSSKERL